jgi:tyrosine-protein phosphatase SIW14
MLPLESTHLFGLPGLVNMGRVAEGIYRGADPSEGGIQTLKDMGIKSILNLSRDSDEGVLAQKYSMNFEYTPIDFFKPVDEHKIEEALGHLHDSSIYPIYVHCAQGRDRTGMVIACYRIESGWSNKDAIDEMWSFGFHFVWSHFLEFMQNYKPTVDK